MCKSFYVDAPLQIPVSEGDLGTVERAVLLPGGLQESPMNQWRHVFYIEIPGEVRVAVQGLDSGD